MLYESEEACEQNYISHMWKEQMAKQETYASVELVEHLTQRLVAHVVANGSAT